ncbi:hypothetical protein GP5015_1588 [gamma proteobacterium HTCC5015]|nr:hypothetical protein GP5015_1588 [gamma proteobacterium HTCC5015]
MRTADLAYSQGIDLAREIQIKHERNHFNGTRGRAK